MQKHLFNIDIRSEQPQSGRLLVAEPFLREKWFNHAVITIVDMEPGERTPAMGVVMNHPSPHNLADLLPGIHVDVPVFAGGPVGTDRLFFIHTLGPDILGSEANSIAPGLWVGGDFNLMTDYVNHGYPIEGHLRFFLGYSGWDAGQLQGEVDRRVWAVSEMTDPIQLLENEGDAYWHRQVRAMGPDFRGWRYHPQDPAMN